MQSFLEFIVKGLVDHPEEATITPTERKVKIKGKVSDEEHCVIVYQLKLHPSDMGKIIGRHGNTINAIRALLQVGSAKQGIRCALEVVEDAAKSKECSAGGDD